MKAAIAFLQDLLLKEWLLFSAAAGLLLTSIYNRHFPVWSAREMDVLYILFALFIAVNGLQQSGLVARVAWNLERGGAIALKLVTGTFFLAMLVTNDVALLVMVPLTLILEADRKALLVILEALAANSGSGRSLHLVISPLTDCRRPTADCR